MMWTANSLRSWILTAGLSILVVIIALAAMIPPGTIPYSPGSEFSDAAISHWPAAAFLRTSVLDHHVLPFWNPLRMLGQPFAANPLNKVWYPPQWLGLILPPTIHLNTLIYLHGVWLTLGMILWARRIGLHPLAASTAALAWAFAPKLIAHLGAGHLDLWYAAAWVPWLLWAVIDAYTLRRIMLIGMIGAMLTLADLRMAFYIIPATLIYAYLSRLLSPRWGIALIIMLGLTAVQIVPLVSLSPSLTRSQITAQQAAEFSLPLQMLIGTFIPDFGGFHEYLTFLGLPVIALALISLRHASRRVIRGWWVMIALSILWALGDNGPLFMLGIRLLSIASWFRVPSRAWLVVALGFAILAAFGVDTLAQHGLPRRARLIGAAAAFAGLLWVAGSVLLLPTIPDLRLAVISLGVVLFISGAGIWIASGVRFMPLSRAHLTSAVIIAVTGVGSYLMLAPTLIDARFVVPPPKAYTTLSSCDLIYSPSFAFLDPAAAALELRTLHTADPFQFRWSADAIAQAANVANAGYSITAPPIPANAQDLRNVIPNENALARLGVTAIIAPYQNPMPLQGESRFNDDLYYLPIPSNDQPLPICDRGPNRFEFEIDSSMTENTPISIAMAWSPDWRAWLNDQPVPTTRVDGALLGIEIPASSKGILTVRYQPTADYVGILITALTILIVLLVWWKVHG